MSLSQKLAEISRIKDKQIREAEAEDFKSKVAGHPEEKILQACAEAASKGKTEIPLQNSLPPCNLKEEGFVLIKNKWGSNSYSFAN